VHHGITDLPRDDLGAAFLGDPRNDENIIVSQLHTVFIRLHNKFRDEGKTFDAAQKQNYQRLVIVGGVGDRLRHHRELRVALEPAVAWP